MSVGKGEDERGVGRYEGGGKPGGRGEACNKRMLAERGERPDCNERGEGPDERREGRELGRDAEGKDGRMGEPFGAHVRAQRPPNRSRVLCRHVHAIGPVRRRRRSGRPAEAVGTAGSAGHAETPPEPAGSRGLSRRRRHRPGLRRGIAAWAGSSGRVWPRPRMHRRPRSDAGPVQTSRLRPRGEPLLQQTGGGRAGLGWRWARAGSVNMIGRMRRQVGGFLRLVLGV